MKKNRIRICGRNTTTEPTPAITPSTTSERRKLSGKLAVIQPCTAAKLSSIQATGASDQANTAWNITKNRPSRIRNPATGWSSTESSACVIRRRGVSETVPATATARARRWAARKS